MKAAGDLVALVTDGRPIDGYGRRCGECAHPTGELDDRKGEFLRLGRLVLRELAEMIGAPAKSVTVNPAGPMLSGDVDLRAGDLVVSASHHLPRDWWGDFYARRAGGPILWMKWEELLDLQAVADRVRALPNKMPSPQSPVAEEEVDPLS